MPQIPHFATPLDAARFLLRENRLHELWFENLSSDDCDAIIVDLKARLSRVRRKELWAHLTGATLTVCFLALGLALMTVGPAAVRDAFDQWVGRATMRDAAATWPILVLLTALGAFTADYLLHRRFKIARMWDHTAAGIQDSIRRAETRRSVLHESSNRSDGGSATAG